MGATDKFGGITIGSETAFSKTITEADLGFFCAISGDFDPLHVDEAYSATTPFGRRIVHGLAVMALLSAAESEMSRRAIAGGAKLRPVSLGYDRVRFLAPVLIGDSLRATYRIAEIDDASSRTIGECTIVNQSNTLCLVGRHIMKWVS